MSPDLDRTAGLSTLKRPRWVERDLGGATGEGVTVAVIDSGWDYSAGDPRILGGRGFVDADGSTLAVPSHDAQDRLGHGTICARLVLSVAPDCRILPLRVFEANKTASLDAVIRAVRWAVDSGARVLNLSLGTQDKYALLPLYQACEWARRRGVMLVGARENGSHWSIPAIFDCVIGVAPMPFDSPFDFRYSPDDAVECAARAGARSVRIFDGEIVESGSSSFAAPYIAGIIALFLEHTPAASLEIVRAMLGRYAMQREPVAASSGDCNEQ